MNLDEAIKHCEEIACNNSNCALEHKQLAEWLSELKKRRNLDSLPEEPASEDLKEEVENWIKTKHFVFTEKDEIIETASHFAEWQKEKLDKQFGFLKLKDCKDAYNEWKSTQDEPSVALAWIRACKWQKKRDDKHIGDLQWEAYLKGEQETKQQMMKNTVLETKVIMDCDGDGIETPYEEWLTLEDTEIPYIPDNLGLKEGDKVKIIIVKEEQ